MEVIALICFHHKISQLFFISWISVDDCGVFLILIVYIEFYQISRRISRVTMTMECRHRVPLWAALEGCPCLSVNKLHFLCKCHLLLTVSFITFNDCGDNIIYMWASFVTSYFMLSLNYSSNFYNCHLLLTEHHLSLYNYSLLLLIDAMI